jgi:hypothetical protein
MKTNRLIVFIILSLNLIGFSSQAKPMKNLKFTFVGTSSKYTQQKYLRFLRYQELMSLSEEKQLQYITGMQKIFSDLVKSHPRFSMNELDETQSPALQALQELIKKYPQLSLLMSEARAQNSSKIRNAGDPVILPENTAGGNPNQYYNDFIQFLAKSPPQKTCTSVRVGDQTLDVGIIEVKFRNKKRYVCATTVLQGTSCPEGFQPITGIAVSSPGEDNANAVPSIPCGKVTQDKHRLAIMQEKDKDPDRPSKPPTAPVAAKPSEKKPSTGATAIDGSTSQNLPLPPPPPPPPPAPPVQSTTSTPSATPPTGTPTANIDIERNNFEAAPRNTGITQFPPNCSQEVYACQFGDESRSAAREAFQQNLGDRDSNCINGANISKYSATAQKCSRVSTAKYGNTTFSCSGNRTLCNPMIFGLLSDDKNPICVPLQMNVTLACSTASTQLGGGNSAANALKFLKANPEMAEAWNTWTQSLEKLCQPGTDRNSHRFHCTECTLIFTHLQKLNALTGYANACGNLLNSLGEGDPMIVNAIVNKSLSGVTGQNPQTPSQPVTPAPAQQEGIQ